MKVWFRPTGGGCKVRVETEDGAKLLAEKLKEHGAVCTGPVVEHDSCHCVFYVSYKTKPAELETLLKGLPDVELMDDPA